MSAGGPTTIRVRDRQVYRSSLFFFPNRTRNLFAVQQVMLDAGEDAAPVTTINRLVHNAANFYINSIATQNSVVNAAEQIEQPALFPHRGLAVGLLIVPPCFRFVLRHGS